MATHQPRSQFHFFPLEDRILLSGDGLEPDEAPVNVDAITLEAIEDHLDQQIPAHGKSIHDDNFVDPHFEETDFASETARVEVILIDGAVEDADQLLDGLRDASPDSTKWIIKKLDSDSDGIQQITEELNDLGGIDAIHLVSHGNQDGIQIGNTWLSEANLDGYAGDIATWADALDDNADLLLYGCDLAASESGRTLIQSLAILCQCDVAASDDATGHNSLNADWNLEHQLGEIETHIAFASSTLDQWSNRLDITTGLELHYEFDSFSTNAAQDSSGNGHSAILTDGGQITQGHVGAGALDFSVDQTDNAVLELPEVGATDLGANDFTIAFWLNTPTGHGNSMIFSDGVSDDRLQILKLASGQLLFEVNGTTDDFGISTSALLFDQWNHVAITRDDHTFTVFLNGSLDQTRTLDVGAITNSSATVLGAANASALNYDGAIDDLRFYNRSLSSTDLTDLYALGGVNESPSDLVITEAIEGGLSINETGNDTLFISSGGLENNLDRFTYEVRFNADAFPGEHVFLSYNVGNEDQLAFQLTNSGNRLELDIGAGAPFYSNAINYRDALVDGEDHTLSVTWENTTGSWQVFIDGALIDSGNGLQVGREVLSGGTFVFGQEQDVQGGNYDANQHFRGTLYEARLFNDLRTVEEIASQHARSVSQSADGLISNWRFDGVGVNGVIADDVGNLTLFQGAATGVGFTIDSATLVFSVDENSPTAFEVGRLYAVDKERDAMVAGLLVSDPSLRYSAFTGKFYRWVSGAVDFDQAQTAAASAELHGVSGQLATIHSEFENELVRSIAGDPNVWIGGTDRAVEGDFHWLENGTESEQFWTSGNGIEGVYNRFALGQPDNLLGQDYLQLNQTDGTWNDHSLADATSLVVEWDSDAVLDAAAPIHYQITSQTVSGAFSIDSSDGTITVANGALLNFDLQPSHTLSLRATDSAGNTYDEDFLVEIRDTNLEQSLILSGPLAVTEGDSVTISNAELFTSDPEQSAAEIRYVLTTDPTDGQLIVNGNAISAGQSFTQQQINDGQVVYEHSGSQSAMDSFSFVVDDGAGTVSNGNMTINVTLVDDPVLVNGPSNASSLEDSPIDFGPAGAGTFTLFDEEQTAVSISVSVTDASVQILSTSGLTMVDSDGSDGTLEFSGDVADLNDALNSLRLTPDAGFNGSATLDLDITDGTSTTLHRVDLVFTPVPTIHIWDGGGASDDWSDPLNWNLDRVPRADDIAVFDTTSVSNSIVDSSFGGAIGAIRVDNGYSGQITLAENLQVANSVTLLDGSFSLSGQNLDIDGDLSTAGSTLDLRNSDLFVAGDLVLAGIELSTNSLLTLDGNANQSVSASGNTLTFDDVELNKTAGLVTFHDRLEISGDIEVVSGGSDASAATLVLTSGFAATIDSDIGPVDQLVIDATSTKNIDGTLEVLGSTELRRIALLNGGTIRVHGDLAALDNTYSGTTVIELAGNSDQSITTNGGTGMIRNLLVAKTGGTATAQEDLELAGIVRHQSGLLDTSSITTKLISINLLVDTSTMTFGDTRFDGFATANIVDTMNIDGDLTFGLVSSLNGGTLVVSGDVISNDTNVPGTTSIRLSGNHDQVISGADLPDGNLVIAKTLGTVTLADDLNLSSPGQDIVVNSGTLSLAGHQISTSGTVEINGGTLAGEGRIDGPLLVRSTGRIQLDALNGAPAGHDVLTVDSLVIETGATLNLDVSGVTSTGTINDVIRYNTRSGTFDNISLVGNTNGYSAYAVFDDSTGSLSIMLNTPPSGAIPNVSVSEDAPNTVVTLSAFVSDPEHSNSSLTFQLVGNNNPALFNSVTIDPSSSNLTLDYASNQNGSATLTVRVIDPFGDSTDIDFDVHVLAQNDPPSLTTNPISTSEGGETVLSNLHLAASDTDTSADQLQFSIVGGPAQGTVLLDGLATNQFTQQQIDAGRVSYRHDGAEIFTDSFSVTLSDGTDVLPAQSIHVFVSPVNDQSVVITSDGGGSVANLAANENSQAVTRVTSFDADLPGDTLRYTITGGNDSTLFQINDVSGLLEFVVAPDAENPIDHDLNGTYHVIVTVTDGVYFDHQSLNVSVLDVNEHFIRSLGDQDPSANQIDLLQPAGTPVGIQFAAVDDDLSNSNVRYSLVDDDGGRFNIDPTTGVVSSTGNFNRFTDGASRTIVVRGISDDGSFVDHFFRVSLIQSNQSPVSTGDDFTMIAGNTLAIAAPGLLANDSDPDSDPLTAHLAWSPEHGTVIIFSDGKFRYTPDSGFVGVDSFTYLANDGFIDGTAVRVQIEVIVGGGVTTPGASGTGIPIEDPGPTSGGDTKSPPQTTPTEIVPSSNLIGNPDSTFQAEVSLESTNDSESKRNSQDRDTGRSDGDGVAVTANGTELADDTAADSAVTAMAGASSSVVNELDDANDAMLQLVFENLFASAGDETVETADTSQEIRQLERILKMDLKQAILWDMWDKNESDHPQSTFSMLIGSAGAAAGFFSIGYVMWALRGGAFVSVIASSLPSWRIIDPAALLTAYRSTQANPSEGLTEIVKTR